MTNPTEKIRMTTRIQSRSSRRHFMAQGAMSLAPLAAAWLGQQEAAANPVKPDLGLQSFNLRAKPSHKPPVATAMISMFMQGGPSQVDLLDPKPLLNKLHLQKFRKNQVRQCSRSQFQDPGNTVEIPTVRSKRDRCLRATPPSR